MFDIAIGPWHDATTINASVGVVTTDRGDHEKDALPMTTTDPIPPLKIDAVTLAGSPDVIAEKIRMAIALLDEVADATQELGDNPHPAVLGVNSLDLDKAIALVSIAEKEIDELGYIARSIALSATVAANEVGKRFGIPSRLGGGRSGRALVNSYDVAVHSVLYVAGLVERGASIEYDPEGWVI
jgi:hypothetical protein